MKAHYKTRSGRLVLELEGATTKEIFRAISEVEEVFGADEVCGCCSSARLKLRHRLTSKYEYFELVCEDCAAALTFGTRQLDGKLFHAAKMPIAIRCRIMGGKCGEGVTTKM